MRVAARDIARRIVGSSGYTIVRRTEGRIAYLHLDLTCAQPEVEALDMLWERLVPGAPALLDDDASRGYEPQRHAMDTFARSKDVLVASLPTGQGLLVRPPGEEATW